MGTNFYCIPKLSRKQLDDINKTIKDVVDNITKESNNNLYDVQSNIRDIIDNLYELIGNMDKAYPKIHLGKRSAGCQFLWEYHDGKYYKDNLESIKEFLSKDDIQIINEYGEPFTIEQFFDDEIKDLLYKDENHYDLDSYYEEYPNESRFYSKQPQWTSKDGLRFDNDEFS